MSALRAKREVSFARRARRVEAARGVHNWLVDFSNEHPSRILGGLARTWAPRVGLFALCFALGAALVLVPVPFVVERPGPTVDVVGTYSGAPVIDIEGTDPTTGEPLVLDPVEAAEGEGQIRMVTVSEAGGPGYRINAIELALAWFDKRNLILPYGEVYPEEVTAEQVREVSQAQMDSSQSTASVAALESLGWEVPAVVTIAAAVPGTDAEGKVREGDVLKAVRTPDGVIHEVDSASVPFAVMRTVPVGSQMGLTVDRAGAEVELTVVSGAGGEGEEGSKLGLYLSAEVSLPVELSISLEKIGGPSAGMVFALGIIDRLTPGDMTGGNSIAGTGTLSYDGKVGAIGGIEQKMWGAVRDGSEWFLAPSANCAEVVGNEPEGLTVVSVSTLEEARDAVEAIAAGQGDALPTCEAN